MKQRAEPSDDGDALPEGINRLDKLARFRALLDQSNDAIFLAQAPSGRLVDVNASACRQLGYTRQELLTRSLNDLVPSGAAAQIDALCAQERRGEQDHERIITKLRKRDGETLLAEITVQRVTFQDVTYVVAVARDVTGRMQDELKLKEAERRFRTLLDNVRLIAVGLDREGKVTYANPYLLELTGHTLKDVLGKDWFQTFIPERDRPQVGIVFKDTLSSKIKPHHENPILTREGQERLIAWNNTLLLDPAGKPVGVMSIGKDITERVQVEEEIRHRNRELALLNRVIAAATSTLDVNQVLRVTCRELAHAFSLPQAAAALLNAEGTHATVVAEYMAPGRPSGLGRPIFVAGNPATQYVLEHKAPLAVTDAQTDERMAANRTLMRDRGTVSLLIIPIIVRGRVVGTIGLDAIERREFSEEEIALAQNVAAAAGQVLETARLYQALQRHAEQLQEMVAERTAELQVALTQAREADRVKSQFVSNVSHELRTPLTNLKLYLNLLTRGYPEKREIYLDTLQREADRLQYLIESLLDLSRLDLGKTRSRLQPTDLNLLVSSLMTDRGALAADRGLSLDVELEKTLPPALADRKLIERVLTNLLTNAINYTPTGGAVMLCTATAEKEAQKWVTFSVTDTGTGISQEEQRHLFERFYRGQAGRASDAPGTGLGLAISKAIVEQHGGRITVESQIGQGSIFTVWLYPA